MGTATKSRHKVDPTERAQLIRMMQDQLAEFEEALEDGAREELLSRITGYSDRNILLIMMQNDQATDVRGYNAWKQAGRQVKHGEKGLRILAPAGHGEEKTTPDGSKTPGRQYFRVVSVFDVSQTEEVTS